MSDPGAPARGSSRQTLQDKMVAKVQTDASHLSSLLEQYAGSSKPNIAVVNVAHYMGELTEWLPKLFSARTISAASSPLPALWRELVTAYEGGQGSWTKCRPLAARLAESLREFE